MTRRRISTRERAKIFDAAQGLCHMCGLKIEAAQAWEVSHPIPIACGGADDATNHAPAHKTCHRVHTATVDAPLIAKVRRQRQAHIGAKQSSGAFGSRSFGQSSPARRATTPLDKIAIGQTAIARLIQESE